MGKFFCENIRVAHVQRNQRTLGDYGRAMVLGSFQFWGVLLIWLIEQGPNMLAVEASGVVLDIFSSSPSYLLSFSFPGRRLDIN